MLFHSYEFIFVFLPMTFFIYFYLNRRRLTNASKFFLVFSSLFFYSWWNISYLPIILLSIIFNYIIGKYLNIDNGTDYNKFSKKSLLTFGIVSNIALLGYFKYTDFMIWNINLLFNANIHTLNLALPLAISFFTFQQISYLVDSYTQKAKEYDFLNYTLFVTFFPQLISGPIVHHKEMMPQFTRTRNKVQNYNNIAAGLFIFSIGLFKKVVIADTFAVWAIQGFDVATTLNLFEAWTTSLSYSLQLYFDFSGYTDMAIGLALLFNIKLPINFNSPYKATNIQDFWRRWHITLSRFLKDYIYIPLGGNRKDEFRTYSNLITTFMIGAIWHGAGWTFMFWGFLHGISIIIYRLWSKLGLKLWSWLAWLITFNFINVAWIFFRAKEWDSAIKVLSSMFNLDNIVISKQFSNFFNYINPLNEYYKFNGSEFQSFVDFYTLEMLVFGFIIITLFKNSNELKLEFNSFNRVHLNLYIFSIFLFGYALIVMSFQTGSEFLYFNF